MTILKFAALAVSVLAFCTAAPAQADSRAGVTMAPQAVAASIDDGRAYCRNPDYRRTHDAACRRYDGSGQLTTAGYRYRGDCRDYEYRRHHQSYCARSTGGDGRIPVSDDRSRDNCRNAIFHLRYAAYCSQYDTTERDRAGGSN